MCDDPQVNKLDVCDDPFHASVHTQALMYQNFPFAGHKPMCSCKRDNLKCKLRHIFMGLFLRIDDSFYGGSLKNMASLCGIELLGVLNSQTPQLSS